MLLDKALEEVETARAKANKKGREWAKFKTLHKQIGLCTATRRCGEPSGNDVLCPKHHKIKQDRDARHRANKVKARAWTWGRVPVEATR